MRFRDPKLLASYKDRVRCEWCNRVFPAGSIVAHHIRTRGAGGSDVPENLLGVDFECHNYLEHVPRLAQYAVLAYILRTTAAALEDFSCALLVLDNTCGAADVERLRETILGRAA